jgi:hypothetical protein
MALVLNTNSYVTTTEADTYFATRIDADEWSTANDALKEQALVTATQLIDNRPWIGLAVSSSQALAWPRKQAIFFDPRMGQDITIAENETPKQVKIAVYEQALHLLQNEDLIAQKTQTFESISVGSISLSDSNSDVGKTSITPSIVLKPLRPLIRKGSAGGTGGSWWRAN